jgi:hypothetical protein
MMFMRFIVCPQVYIDRRVKHSCVCSTNHCTTRCRPFVALIREQRLLETILSAIRAKIFKPSIPGTDVRVPGVSTEVNEQLFRVKLSLSLEVLRFYLLQILPHYKGSQPARSYVQTWSHELVEMVELGIQLMSFPASRATPLSRASFMV